MRSPRISQLCECNTQRESVCVWCVTVSISILFLNFFSCYTHILSILGYRKEQMDQ